ncbi:MAG: adenylate/guanylate cyclase domain-containing protein [Nitrosomonas sp.]|nr:adenylate/guanylate cyclase domain-containing protein [Nitrosomonas sp.]MCW5607134.1 adenylate/guanylate cyclase domain-containing protein [Nitrosomonas sp.]
MMPFVESDLEHKLVITSIGQNIWGTLRSNTATALDRLKLRPLLEPTVFLLHQMTVHAIKALHYNVFKQIILHDFGFSDIDHEIEFDAMFENEINEHGDKNIAKFCRENSLYVMVSFPDTEDTIAAISAPCFCCDAIRLNDKLIKTLGYRLEIQEMAGQPNFYSGTLNLYRQRMDLSVFRPPVLMSRYDQETSSREIFTQLSYSIVCFNSLGTIQSLSPSLLSQLDLKENESSVAVFLSAIPKRFYNDVIWGVMMDTPHGKFENYRMRLKTGDDHGTSVLFNVSGFRDSQGIIHTLWQEISLDGKNSSALSEGSILNEARVHNITRNYVPQLVEQKAREVVRLGGNLLSNEECHIAILFCDIVGFTTYVEKNEKEESIIHTLNSILRRISLSVKKHGGFIDKFMGDCIMVLFRNPRDAVIAALEMQNHSVDINFLRERANLDRLLLRIGIHWGKVVIGNVGTPERLDWTAIGDVVNTASRIEKNCRPEHVLISQSMRDVIETGEKPDFKYGETFSIVAKGKKNALPVCYVYSAD